MPLDQREPDDAVMSFGDHLEELRKRLFLAALVPLPLAIGLFFVAPQIRAILTDPVLDALRAEGLPAHISQDPLAEKVAPGPATAMKGERLEEGHWTAIGFGGPPASF